MKRWNDFEIDNAIDLITDGKSYNDIGKILNRTSSSIRCKLIKLGYQYLEEQKIERICLNCLETFKTFRKSDRKFCNHSCSAVYNNKKRIYKKGDLHNCLNCGKEISNKNIYCDNKCQGEEKTKVIYKKIENGDTTLTERNYRSYLINKFGNQCMECGWNEINPTTKKVPIQLEHIDGNSDNHNLTNLKLLCPNCHSLTPTFGALNKGNGRSIRKTKRNEKRHLR